MKTTQEIADELARKFSFLADELNKERGGFDSHDEVEKILTDCIPLTQLLEVARTANNFREVISKYPQGTIRYAEAVEGLHIALNKLQQSIPDL